MYVSVVVIVCLMIYCFWKSSKRRSSGALPPAFARSFPIIGHAYILIGDDINLWKMGKKFADFLLKNAGVFYVDLGLQRVTMVADPVDSTTVLNTCLSKPFLYQFTKPLLEYGLITCNPPLTHRPLYISLFSHRNIRMDLFNKYSRIFVDKLLNHVGESKIATSSYFSAFTMETTLEFIYGDDKKLNTPYYNELYLELIEAINETWVTRFMNPLLHNDFIYKMSPLSRKTNKLASEAIELTYMRIESAKEKLEASLSDCKSANTGILTGQPKTVFEMVMEENREGKFTNAELRDHLDTMLLAGYDTTYLTMVLVACMIGSHQDIQDKIYKELLEVVGDIDRDLDRNDLLKLEYMEAVIKETLRLYPIVPHLGRQSNTEVKLRNYTIPAGMFVMSAYAMHRHSLWGKDAEDFKPDRWLKPGGIPENAFAGFSLGKRGCTGKVFGLTMIKTFFAHMIRRYKISADISKLVLAVHALIRPVSGYEIQLELRNTSS